MYLIKDRICFMTRTEAENLFHPIIKKGEPLKKSNAGVSVGMKIALALMFIPIMSFIILVGTKTVLPVFPVNAELKVHTFVFFERYSKTALNESLEFSVLSLILGMVLLIRLSLDKGVHVLWAEFRKDLENTFKSFLREK
jgi:hypothetical protein